MHAISVFIKLCGWTFSHILSYSYNPTTVIAMVIHLVRLLTLSQCTSISDPSVFNSTLISAIMPRLLVLKIL